MTALREHTADGAGVRVSDEDIGMAIMHGYADDQTLDLRDARAKITRLETEVENLKLHFDRVNAQLSAAEKNIASQNEELWSMGEAKLSAETALATARDAGAEAMREAAAEKARATKAEQDLARRDAQRDARIAALEAGLRPFADFIADHPRAGNTMGYDAWLNAMRHSVSWPDFDRAAALLATPSCTDAGWRPIDSAPKDITPVLIVVEPGIARGINCPDTRAIYVGWRWADGEYTVFTNGAGIVARVKATHWRPLPPPPAPDAADASVKTAEA